MQLTAVLVPEPSAPEFTWQTNCLFIRALDPVLLQPQGPYTFPTLCLWSQPLKKAQKPFSMLPSMGQQENKDAVSPSKRGSLVWGREGVCTATRSVSPPSPSREGSCSLLCLHLAREESHWARCGPVSLMGEGGGREFRLGPDSGLGRPPPQLKTNK